MSRRLNGASAGAAVRAVFHGLLLATECRVRDRADPSIVEKQPANPRQPGDVQSGI